MASDFSAEEEQERIIDVTPDSALSEKADINAIKRKILQAKTQDSLDEIESEIYEVMDDKERNKLIELWKSKSEKSVQEETAKKPDDVPQEPDTFAEQEEVKAVDTSRSPELRKKYIHELNNAKTEKELAVLSRAIEAETGLTDTHRTYLHSVEQGRMEELSKQSKAIDVNKSERFKAALLHQINEANTLDDLEVVAKNITTNSSKMTPEHNQEVLTAYAQRKEVLSQEDMFSDVQQVSFVDAVIQRIQNAKNQDDINAEYDDPAIEELSDEERQRIDAAASQRENELFG